MLRAFPRPVAALILALLLVPPGAAAAERAAAPQSYVAGIEDLPLMPGLAPVAGEALLFDKPAGRIVQSLARGAVSAEAVTAFYAATLPQLGWTPLAPGRYGREGEALAIDFPEGRDAGRAGGLTVRFALSPQ